MKKKTVIPTLLAEVIILALVLGINLMLSSGGTVFASNFIDIPLLVLLLLFVIPSMVASGQWKPFIRAFSIGKKDYGIKEIKKTLEAVKLTMKYVLCGSLMLLMVAGIIILTRLNEIETFGNNLGVAFISVFYCSILEVFLATIEAHVQNALTDAMSVDE